jgi:hypothetical protein
MSKYIFTTGFNVAQYHAGYTARDEQKPYSTNPCERNTTEYYSWARGWLDADRILEGKREIEK